MNAGGPYAHGGCNHPYVWVMRIGVAGGSGNKPAPLPSAFREFIMNIYRLSRPSDYPFTWDEYIEFIVAANDENEARSINQDSRYNSPSWIPKDRVVVELIGTAKEDTEVGIICASFNAG